MNTLVHHDLGNGITCLDSQYVRTGLACCYLIEENGHAAFIDVGTNYTVPLILKLLAQKNIPLENVDYVIPTHVHLDHAGGAGSLMQYAPNAQLIIHPRGARHLIDPSRLQAGATAVYGKEEFALHYGDLIAIDEGRVTQADDGFTLDFQGRQLNFLDTPGHAKHHFCIIDKKSKGMFTGDTFGVAYPELSVDGKPFIFPPSSPVDFDPDAWLHSIDRLMQTGSERAYLTHYSRIENLTPLASILKQRILLFAAMAQQAPNQATLEKLLNQYFIDEVLASGCQLSPANIMKILTLDISIVAQGLIVWLEKNG